MLYDVSGNKQKATSDRIMPAFRVDYDAARWQQKHQFFISVYFNCVRIIR
jgi:hypothetical protein